MPRFSAAATFDHALPARTAVLLVQLGTPDEPTPAAVRRFLGEFLADPRVVEIPAAAWRPILHGVVLRTRPAKSAAKYASVWGRDGSPLMVQTARQALLLRGALGERGHDIEVAFAMRYGNPSVASVLRDLRERNVTRLLVLPLYPQYAASTTASAFDAVSRELRNWRNLPELRLVRSFHDDDGYLDALAARITASWEADGPPQKLVMSFHGVPRRSLMLGDPYHCECLATGRLLAERLGLRRDDWVLSFQSRFGRAQWLQPYTEPVLHDLGRSGIRRVDVVCPGFVAECLETLEEIAIEGKQAFVSAGGQDYRYIACLNDSPAFIDALATLVLHHTTGWATGRLDAAGAQARQQTLSARAQQARALGAAR
ncbi:MAG: ferrochelatase [Burkholderiales bacterium]|nr:ferrochelatase [Burkholderiales bacterium]ODU62907.1 MAG: ferrochelatase [Lautropia sp. SCN 66-9]